MHRARHVLAPFRILTKASIFNASPLVDKERNNALVKKIYPCREIFGIIAFASNEKSIMRISDAE